MLLNLCDTPLEISCLLLLVLVIYFRRIFRKNHRHIVFAGKLPGPFSWPFIGNSLDFWNGGTAGVCKITDYCKKYGGMYRLWFGRHLFIVMSDPNELKTVFYKTVTLDKPELFLTSYRDFLGNGLSTCPMDIWRKTRGIMQPLYGKKELKFYIPEMNRIIHQFVENMDTLASKNQEFDVCERLSNITINIIMKTNFDMEFTSHEISNLKIRSCNKILSEAGFLTMFRSWLHIPIIYYLRYYLIQKKIKRDLQEFTKTLLESKLSQLKVEESGADASKPGISRMPFLSNLYKLQDDETLNEEWLRDQIAFLIIAGTDGVAIMMSFFLLSIAMNPAIQDRLHEELDKVFHDDDRQASYDDVERLVYLDQVLKETERRYTFLPFIFRNVDEDCRIGEHDIPAGTAILINVEQIHHDEKYYPDPYKFNPEHFTPEAESQRPMLSFLPFSHGPRNCIAVHYAALVMKLTLIALLRRFTFHTTMTDNDIEVNVGMITTCVNGYNLSVKLRSHTSREVK